MQGNTRYVHKQIPTRTPGSLRQSLQEQEKNIQKLAKTFSASQNIGNLAINNVHAESDYIHPGANSMTRHQKLRFRQPVIKDSSSNQDLIRSMPSIFSNKSESKSQGKLLIGNALDRH